MLSDPTTPVGWIDWFSSLNAKVPYFTSGFRQYSKLTLSVFIPMFWKLLPTAAYGALLRMHWPTLSEV